MKELEGTMLVKNANVFGPEPLGLRDILVVEGKIVLIEKDLEKPGWVEEVLDCEGHILVPGLIDLHVHLLGGGGEAGPASRLPEVSHEELVAAGVTTCVGCLGTDDVTRHLESLLAKARSYPPRPHRLHLHRLLPDAPGHPHRLRPPGSGSHP